MTRTHLQDIELIGKGYRNLGYYIDQNVDLDIIKKYYPDSTEIVYRELTEDVSIIQIFVK